MKLQMRLCTKALSKYNQAFREPRAGVKLDSGSKRCNASNSKISCTLTSASLCNPSSGFSSLQIQIIHYATRETFT